jgi:hypothetical protein
MLQQLYYLGKTEMYSALTPKQMEVLELVLAEAQGALTVRSVRHSRALEELKVVNEILDIIGGLK